jgi:hypothetical protein
LYFVGIVEVEVDADGVEKIAMPIGLDEATDKDMIEVGDALCTTDCGEADVDETADIETFNIPAKHHVMPPPPSTRPKDLKKAGKFAYKFPEGWEVGTFRDSYKGKDPNFKGQYDIYFAAFRRKGTVTLRPIDYGLGKTWVCFKPRK